MTPEREEQFLLAMSAMATGIARTYLFTVSNVTEGMTVEERRQKMDEARDALDDMFKQIDILTKGVLTDGR